MEITINKGNYEELETPERVKAFHAARAFGNEATYYAYRREWETRVFEKRCGEYPLHIDIELSTVCNLNCPFCYTITDEFKQRVRREFMDFRLFKRIIDELAGKTPSVRLSLRGESTLHPDYIKCINYAKRKGVVELSSLTNLSMMTPVFFEKVLLAGLDWLTVSFDGLYDEYERSRYPLKFEESYEKLRKMKEIKAYYNIPKPVVKVQAVWPCIEKDPSAFYNMLSPVCDEVAFNPLMDYSNIDDYEEDPSFACPQIYQRLVIQSNGRACFCAFDEFSSGTETGNANAQSIFEIWNGEPISEVRRLHEEEGWRSIELCRHCPITKAVKEDIFMVDGREVVVKNYCKKKGDNEKHSVALFGKHLREIPGQDRADRRAR
jgi:MoaA/NifB/PqqE/SkfB family radical SAM enzyme